MSFLYLDSSIVLRFLLRQPDHLELRGRPEFAAASALTRVESLRSLDRLRLAGTDELTLALRRATLEDLLAHTQTIDLTPAILSRAASPLSVPLGTLDAVHLASALSWSEWLDSPVTFATHDRALARAARMYGFPVTGVAPE
ncbi:MAG: type II toxin-antitoxin system VapC family toxin [Terriglobales bacterium]